MSDDLIKWFAEENGFSHGTKAPHKWVLQAAQELRVQGTALADAQAEIARLKADKAALGQAVQAVCDTAKAEVDRLTEVLRTIADGRHDRPATKFARAALTDKPDAGKGE